jgi:uncharacterized cupredoxin-like copper-binding protein
MRKILLWVVVFLGLSLILTGCGGGSSAASSTISVTMTDFMFSPNSFTVPAGQQITLNASNNGTVIHNFVVMKFGQSAGTSFGDEDLPNVFWQIEVQPGVSTSATFTAPTEPGNYEVVCRTAGHLEAGMKARLTVVAGK